MVSDAGQEGEIRKGEMKFVWKDLAIFTQNGQ